jgi:hypothetical protein
LPVKKAFGTKFVMFGGEGGTSDLGMYKREALAKYAAVQPEGSGFHGFRITQIVDVPQRIDELLARVARAGGKIVRRPVGAGQGPTAGPSQTLTATSGAWPAAIRGGWEIWSMRKQMHTENMRPW